MLQLNYSEQEQQRIHELNKKIASFQPVILPDVPRDVIDAYNEIHTITQNVEKRALAYYCTKLEELVEDIQDTLKDWIIFIPNLPKNAWLAGTINTLELFLILLKDKSTELYEKTLDIINQTYDNREKIQNSDYAKKLLENFKAQTPNIEVVRPQQLIVQNTRAGNKVFKQDNIDFYQEPFFLDVQGKRNKKDISVSLFMKYNKEYEQKFIMPIDRPIYDAIVTHYVNGNEYITTNMIYQVISGNSYEEASSHHISKSLSKAINESFERLLRTWIEIDASEHAKAYGFDSGMYKGHLITGSMAEASLNGQITTCLHITETPVLYKYADNCGQVIRYNVKMLNIPSLENSPECIVLKNYLLQQIHVMKNNIHYNRNILFETIYELLDIQATSEDSLKHKKKQIRDHVTTCLECWKAENLIEGYEINKKGKSIASVTVFVKIMKKSSNLPKLPK